MYNVVYSTLNYNVLYSTLNVQCTVQYTLLLLYLIIGNVLLYTIYQLNFTIFMYECYTNITLHHVTYSVRYYPRFYLTAVGL
jgi:hypothetical protein